MNSTLNIRFIILYKMCSCGVSTWGELGTIPSTGTFTDTQPAGDQR